ncbi:hypothetical protein K1719_012694 [Acacia pycnantha]|nr:hypothetical protein K1719_012694 [Acacia pycnantha]
MAIMAAFSIFSWLCLWRTSFIGAEIHSLKPGDVVNKKISLTSENQRFFLSLGPLELNSNLAYLFIGHRDTSTEAERDTNQDSGNYVLLELQPNGFSKQVLWQSFDHPSDILLPGMKLGVNHKTHQSWSVTGSQPLFLIHPQLQNKFRSSFRSKYGDESQWVLFHNVKVAVKNGDHPNVENLVKNSKSSFNLWLLHLRMVVFLWWTKTLVLVKLTARLLAGSTVPALPSKRFSPMELDAYITTDIGEQRRLTLGMKALTS